MCINVVYKYKVDMNLMSEFEIYDSLSQQKWNKNESLLWGWPQIDLLPHRRGHSIWWCDGLVIL